MGETANALQKATIFLVAAQKSLEEGGSPLRISGIPSFDKETEIVAWSDAWI